MTGSTDTLVYSLFQDAGRTTVWGETVGVNTTAGLGDGTLQSYTVYGRIVAQQGADVGAYVDVVTVTLEF